MRCRIPVGGTILEPDQTQLELFEVLVAAAGTCFGGVVVTLTLARITRRKEENARES